MPNVPAITLPSGGAFGYVPTSDPQQDSATHTLIGGGGGGGADVLDTYIVATTGTGHNNPNDVVYSTVNGYGPIGSRPGTSTEGFVWFDSGTGQFYRWTSGGWISITPIGTDTRFSLPITIAQGGTGATSIPTAFDNLSPTTTRGDLIVRGAANNVRLGLGTNGQQLLSNGTDATWAAEPGFGFFGDGSDGVQNFDGSTTILGLAPVSSVYTLTRDIYLAGGSQLSNANTQIKTASFRVFCSGLLTLAANTIISNDGNPASANTGGAQVVSKTLGGGGLAGGNGVVGAGAGTGGGSSAPSAGGAGGAGGGSTGSGGSGGGAVGGTNTLPTATLGGVPHNALQAIQMTEAATGTNAQVVGGSSGGGGASVASSTSGGGGSGGGICGVYVQRIINNGTIRANGGAGANASGTGTGAGGGGGGGGGAVYLVCGPGSTVGVTQANGGAGGAPQGAGNNGVAGGPGNVVLLNV